MVTSILCQPILGRGMFLGFEKSPLPKAVGFFVA
jgi:hypothetical protein